MAASEMARWVRAFFRSRRPGSGDMGGVIHLVEYCTRSTYALGVHEHEVIVVGAGPTGLMLATELALAGCR